MITSQQALNIVLTTTRDFGIEKVPFSKAIGRTLKEDIKADRDFPPFNRVSMDGIAILYETFKKGVRSFKIENVQAAGSAQKTLKDTTNCLEVMTGAVLPKNTDTIIPYELINIEDEVATIAVESLAFGQHIHQQGKDQKADAILLKKNGMLTAAEIGLLATVGKSMVKVAKQPKVLIISTGDELVEVEQQPLDFQIRRSNVHSLVSLLKKIEIEAQITHISDDKVLLTKKIEDFLSQFDVLIFSGAVSKGKYDFLPEVLESLGVEKLFHKVKQRPGKPFWFGKKEKTYIFAFPGNPVSTFISCLKYFYPWYKKSVGLVFENYDKAILAEDIDFKPELTYFLQVRLENKKGLLVAIPLPGNGSGDLSNLAKADGFLELPDTKSEFKTGEIYPLIKFR